MNYTDSDFFEDAYENHIDQMWENSQGSYKPPTESFDKVISQRAAQRLQEEDDMMQQYNDYTAREMLKERGYLPNSPEANDLYTKLRKGLDANLPYEQLERIISPVTKVMQEELPITTKLMGLASGASVPFRRGKGKSDNESRYYF